MKTLRYRSRGQQVHFLEDILNTLGYDVYVSNYFGKDTHKAIMDFQQKNNLVIDGIVGLKTWSKLIEAEKNFTLFNDKFLAEEDMINFAKTHNLDIAVVKAVNEIESSGKGFLIDGRPRILFEGHVFWRTLEQKGIPPDTVGQKRTKDVLYKRWTKRYYKGGAGEYTRLEKAAGMSDEPAFHDAAYSAASWGAFQIMGYHYAALGYASVDHFVSEMYEHEREHLKAFGKFINTMTFRQKTLMHWLRNKDWAKFAEGYNGSGYRKNSYHTKLQKAYERYRVFS